MIISHKQSGLYLICMITPKDTALIYFILTVFAAIRIIFDTALKLNGPELIDFGKGIVIH